MNCPKCGTIVDESSEEAQYIRTIGMCLTCIARRQKWIADEAQQNAEREELETELDEQNGLRRGEG